MAALHCRLLTVLKLSAFVTVLVSSLCLLYPFYKSRHIPSKDSWRNARSVAREEALLKHMMKEDREFLGMEDDVSDDNEEEELHKGLLPKDIDDIEKDINNNKNKDINKDINHDLNKDINNDKTKDINKYTTKDINKNDSNDDLDDDEDSYKTPQYKHKPGIHRNLPYITGLTPPPLDPDKGVDEDHFIKDEIDITPELRHEIWPTKPPKTTRRPKRIRGAIQTTPESPSGVFKVHMQSTGQLGDQLFEFAALYGIARATKRQAFLSPRFILTALFSNITIPEEAADPDAKLIKEDGPGRYSAGVYTVPYPNTLLCCYFQSWRYFHMYSSEIRSQLRFNEEILQTARRIIKDTVSQFITEVTKSSDTDTHTVKHKSLTNYFQNVDLIRNVTKGFHFSLIGVHVYRPRPKNKKETKTVGKTNRHSNKTRTTEENRIAPAKYYDRAMQYFRTRHPDSLFIVVSRDMDWCRKNINTEHGDVMFAGTNAASVDLALLSLMKHNVISSGAFGWWGAWLAKGDVVYYLDWIERETAAELGGKQRFKKQDYYPPWWLAISANEQTTPA